MGAPTLASLQTVAGATILTWALMYVIVRALALTADALDRFGALLAVLIGVVVTVAAVALGVVNAAAPDFGQAVVNGIFAGLAAVGVNEVGKAGNALASGPK